MVHQRYHHDVSLCVVCKKVVEHMRIGLQLVLKAILQQELMP